MRVRNRLRGDHMVGPAQASGRSGFVSHARRAQELPQLAGRGAGGPPQLDGGKFVLMRLPQAFDMRASESGPFADGLGAHMAL